MSGTCTDQSGIVKKVEGKELHVKITSRSACSGCHAKSACMVMDEKEKMIIVDAESGYKVGDKVEIEINNKMGLQAVLWGYFAPFLIVLILLLIMTRLGFNEVASGTVSLASLVPYFIILYMFKDKLKNKFKFKLK